MQKCDVLVVGAGPAGSIAGKLCAESGFDTVIVEKRGLPREKTCGGGITSKTISLLREIGCYEEKVFESFCTSLAVHFPSTGKHLYVDFDTPFMGTVQRSVFDMSLAAQARNKGAEVLEGERFLTYRRTSNNFLQIRTDKRTVSAKVLVGADGALSLVRRSMEDETGIVKRTNSKEFNTMLFAIECDLPAHLLTTLCPQTCHLFFNLHKKIGYVWAFPKNGVFNVGMGGRYVEFSSFNQILYLKRFVGRLSDGRATVGQLRGAPIPVFGLAANPLIQKKNVLLVGDAAKFTDGWTGEGLYYSVKSAIYACNVIKEYLSNHGKNSSCLSKYKKLCANDFFGDLRLSYLFSQFFMKWASAYRLLENERAMRLFAPFLGGNLSYKVIVKKSLKTLITHAVRKA